MSWLDCWVQIGPGRTNLELLRSEEPSNSRESLTLAGDRLRGAGLRSTPQRRAILASFHGGAAEHLSADEVYARATVSLPDLGRGTVYATLAEFSELGLLAAFGTPEPVRYEINIGRHGHFRCRVCLRIYDVAVEDLDPEFFEREGHQVEVIDLRAEGVCCECVTYEGALETSVETILASGASGTLADDELAVGEMSTPVGGLLVAASADGVARVAFPEHADVEHLRRRLGRPAPEAAVDHLTAALDQLRRYFAGETMSFDLAIDWTRVGHRDALRAAMDIPSGGVRSYHLLSTGDSVSDQAEAYGTNPIPIISPCHRVTCGAAVPEAFSGGRERRTWLLDHERRTPGPQKS